MWFLRHLGAIKGIPYSLGDLLVARKVYPLFTTVHTPYSLSSISSRFNVFLFMGKTLKVSSLLPSLPHTVSRKRRSNNNKMTLWRLTTHSWQLNSRRVNHRLAFHWFLRGNSSNCQRFLVVFLVSESYCTSHRKFAGIGWFEGTLRVGVGKFWFLPPTTISYPYSRELSSTISRELNLLSSVAARVLELLQREGEPVLSHVAKSMVWGSPYP